MKFKTFVGLEVHIELKAKSKMFCGCVADYFGHEANTLCCPVCLGLPGSLPVPNKKAVEDAIFIGLALNCQVNKYSYFDRKNYFYPDLPKGYQISQHYQPFCFNGNLVINVNNEIKKVRIREVHLEEDTGKLLHQNNRTLIDFNRSGVPLVEIVSEPDLKSSNEVKEYLKRIQQLVRYLEVSDCDMEKGSMRCEPSVSIRDRRLEIGDRKDKLPDYRVEIKNINSFKFAQRAVEYEIERQRKILEKGERVIQETRGWSESKQATVSQREKEEARDYRYFPEPDIPPIVFSDKDIKILRAKLPELPNKKMERFIKTYGLNEYDSKILTEERWTAEYFEETVKELRIKNYELRIKSKQIANLIINKKVDIRKTKPQQLVQMVVSGLTKQTIEEGELKKAIEKVLKENEKAVKDYREGKEQAIMFLVGCVMRETKGKAEAGKVKELLKNQLLK